MSEASVSALPASAAGSSMLGRAKQFNISKWALEHPALTRYLLVVLMVLGLSAYFQLGQDEDPPFTFRAMVVRAYWPGATAQQIADQVTDKLEKTLQEVPYADKIRSYSKPGETLIIFQVKDSSPPKEMAQIWYTVRKKVSDMRGTLPGGVIGPFFNDEFGDVYGSIYSLSSDGFSYEQLKEQADRVRQRLLKVKDVNKVEIFGAQDEKIFVEISQKRLAQLGLDFNTVIAQLGQQNAVESAGVIDSPTDFLQVRVGGQFNSVDDLKVFPIRAGGNSFKLGDIATVKRAYVDPPQVKVRDRGKEVIGLGSSMAKGGDIIALGLLVDDAIIAVEMMVRKLEEGYDKTRAATFAYEATAMPMLTGTLITAVGFLPIGMAKSTVGEYTFAIFAVTAAALLISWLVSVYFVPYIRTLLLKPKPHAAGDQPHELFDTPFYTRFRSLVNWCVQHRWITIGLTIGTLVLGLVGMGKVQNQFFPDSSRLEVLVDLWYPEGTSFSANEEVTKRVESRIAKLDGVDHVTTWIGSGLPRFALVLDQSFPQSNVSQLVVLPKEQASRERLRKMLPEILATEFP